MSEACSPSATIRPAVFIDISQIAAVARQRDEIAAVVEAERTPDSPLQIRIRAAEEQADQLMVDTQAQAAALLEAVRREADEIREQARQDGYRAGFQEGYAAGSAAAEAEANRLQTEYRSDLEAMVAQIEEERRSVWRESEQQIISFALEIAQKVVKDDAQVNRDIAISVIRNALRRIVEGGRIRIRVSVEDLRHVRSSRDRLIGLVDGLDNVEIVEDRRVSTGGCVVETPSGTIDARFETQFAELASSLDRDMDEAA